MADRTRISIPYRSSALPIVDHPPAERADAARNRRKILYAAAKILADKGAEGLSLDDVARAANVGVGTVYRRFGDRAGLINALLDERERQFQVDMMMGPPPLGPGAAPAERIRAFLHALVDRVDEQRELLLLTETTAPVSRYGSGPYGIRHIHLVTLLTQVRPHADAHYLADALLAPLTASLITYQRRQRGLSVKEIKSGLNDLLELTGVATVAARRTGTHSNGA